MKYGWIFNAVLAIAVVVAGVMLVQSGERAATSAAVAAQSAKRSADSAKQVADSMAILAAQVSASSESRQKRRVARPGLEQLMDGRARYLKALTEHVKAHFVVPDGLTMAYCYVRIKQLPDGQIMDYRLLETCGSQAADNAVVKAIRDSSPLPRAPLREVFESEMEFFFQYP